MRAARGRMRSSVLADRGAVMAGAVARARGWVWNPAGADDVLARACEELKSGRFGLAREALRECERDFGVRARRSALLASVAAGVDAVDHWAREEPDSRDAALLAARTAVVRARRAAANGVQGADGLVLAARERCLSAARAYPADPTPWVALLMLAPALAQVGLRAQRTVAQGREAFERYNGVGEQERWSVRAASALGGGHSHAPLAPRGTPVRPAAYVADALEGTLVVGPWDLWFEVVERDALNREAHHRMLECLSVHDAHTYAHLITDATVPAGALQLLPLAANLAHYRWLSATSHSRPGEGGAAAVWGSRALHARCLELYEGWFPVARAAGGAPPVADYSLLAHALTKVGEGTFAATVIEAMKPYASTYPWSVTGGGGGEREFERVAGRLHVSAPRPMSGWEHRELYGT